MTDAPVAVEKQLAALIQENDSIRAKNKRLLGVIETLADFPEDAVNGLKQVRETVDHAMAHAFRRSDGGGRNLPGNAQIRAVLQRAGGRCPVL